MDFERITAPVIDVGTEENVENEVLKQIADHVISPVLVSFIWWVLTNAIKNGRKRLYFLARDGYIMYKVAMQFCDRFDLGIKCRYLHGSRFAWRNAVYHLIGEEKYKYIFSGGYQLTPRIILKRVKAGREQRHRIYNDINQDIHIESDRYDLSNENQVLNSKSMKIFAERLKKSRIFSEYLDYTSSNQFRDTSLYLNQEGVFDGNDVVLVDSGWTGSVQRTLRQIAEYNDKSLNITGYYFGLYAHPDDFRDGRYEAWYFNPKSPISIMTSFNNNVFECMCSSPFNMTIGYEFTEDLGKYSPVYNRSNDNNSDKTKQLNYYIETYTYDFLNNRDINFEDYNGIYLEKSRAVLQRFMINPTKNEAEAFGQFKFCDDASDSYENNLACLVDKKYLKNYIIVNRLLYKVSKKKYNKAATANLFWLHGSLALSEIKNQKRYRFNYKLWEWLRLFIKKYRIT